MTPATQINRLPALPPSQDFGVVYVVRSWTKEKYKIGFTRKNLQRRITASRGELVHVIFAGKDPSALECAIHHRFKDKRTSGPGFKREWFALDEADLEWLFSL